MKYSARPDRSNSVTNNSQKTRQTEWNQQVDGMTVCTRMKHGEERGGCNDRDGGSESVAQAGLHPSAERQLLHHRCCEHRVKAKCVEVAGLCPRTEIS